MTHSALITFKGIEKRPTAEEAAKIYVDERCKDHGLESSFLAGYKAGSERAQSIWWLPRETPTVGDNLVLFAREDPLPTLSVINLSSTELDWDFYKVRIMTWCYLSDFIGCYLSNFFQLLPDRASTGEK